MKNHPRVWVWIILQKEWKILIGKRKAKHWKWVWWFPWWHLEQWESWKECVNRELFEEVGIKASNITYLTATNDIFSEDKHYITIFMLANYNDWEIKNMEPDKCEWWEWFNWNN